jgi:multiple antibiotic resistance protein
MTETIHAFALAFVPLFIAIDAPMAVPVFVTLTSDVSALRRKRVADEAVVAALAVGFLFLLAGTTFFRFAGITENDFRIGGGLVLLVTSIMQLSRTSKPNVVSADDGSVISGATPLGIPLVMGPASITTIILVAKSYGYLNTGLAIGLNLLIVWLAFRNAKHLINLIGAKNMGVLAKLASLILVSIAVMMIRVGIKNFLSAG